MRILTIILLAFYGLALFSGPGNPCRDSLDPSESDACQHAALDMAAPTSPSSPVKASETEHDWKTPASHAAFCACQCHAPAIGTDQPPVFRIAVAQAGLPPVPFLLFDHPFRLDRPPQDA